MSETLVEPTRVYRFGRKKTLHTWRVRIAGDDARGYWCEVVTHCGLRVSGNNDAENVLGFASCPDCEVAQ